MKLKPIIASLMLLGLTAPAFAASNAATQSQLDAMKAQINAMEAIINQNNAGGYQQLADWTNRITISGMLNVDGSYASRTVNFGVDPQGLSPPIVGPGKGGVMSNLAVNNANIFIDAIVNDWVKVHSSLLFANNVSVAFTRDAATTQAANGFSVDEFYATIGNFAQSPFYFRAGTEYVPFGLYQRYPMVKNPTQLLSETRATAAQLGFVVPMGFYGSVYGFRGMPSVSQTNGTLPDTPRTANFGANLGYAFCAGTVNGQLDVGYIYNMSDVDYITQGFQAYNNKVSGLSVGGKLGVANFDFNANYVTALGSFNPANVARFLAVTPPAEIIPTPDATSGARPSAWGVDVGYSFKVVNNHTSRVGVGFQHTNQASVNMVTGSPGTNINAIGAYGLPKNRGYIDYTVNISKCTDIGVEIYRDWDYKPAEGGTGKQVTAGVLRLGVKFA